MHPRKNIQKLSELNDFFTSSDKVGKTFYQVLKMFNSGQIGALLTTLKKRGYFSGDLLTILILMPFAGISSVNALFFSGMAQFTDAQKDAYYRLKNLQTVDWRKLLWLFARRFRKLAEERGSSSDVSCFILDDSLVAKTEKFTEGVSRVYDHVTQRYLWGFKLLTAGWWDGKSFTPLDFSLHRERGKNKKNPFGLNRKQRKKQYQKKRKKGTPGQKRKEELDTTKMQQAIKMLARAVKKGFVPDYVLADSWFFSAELLKKVRALKKGTIHLIAMCKMGKIKFEYQGSEYTPKQLKQLLKGKETRCTRLRARYITCQATYKGIPVKLFLVRYAGNKNWRLMVTTNLSLNFIRMMEIYSIRWSIEVFFKEAKQHLNLGKSQSRDFDAQIADITISMLQYMMLNLSKRFSSYETLGQLFQAHSRQMLELTLAERIWGVLLALLREICHELETDPECLLEKMLKSRPESKLLKILAPLLEPEATAVKKAA